MGRIKSLDEIKAMARERTGKRNVFRRARIEDVDPVLERLTVVINFGGIDSYKPECHEYDEELLRAGLGVCAMDMPGVGEAPIKGSTTAESLFSAVIDYLCGREDIDACRIAILGRSFGG